MTETFPPPDYVVVESDLPGIEVYAPVPVPAGDHREVVPFKCPRCAATTAYSIPDGSLVCAHCGYRQSFAQEAVGSRAEDFEFTVEVVERAGRGWNVERKELVCQNCGAQTVVPADALASTCPFCASNRVIQRQAPQDVLRPRFLVPFKLAEEDVRSIAREWLGSSWMTPRELRRAAVHAQFNAIYLPAWTFSAGTRGEWTAEVGYEKKDRRGNRQLVWQRKSGSVQLEFDDTLMSGTSRISPALLAQAWNFDLHDLTAYDPAYLAGLQAQAYDVPLETAWETARAQMREAVREAGRKQALEPANAKQIRNYAVTVDFADETWRYVLLPFHLAAYPHRGRSYQIVINGQTGSIAGQRPPDWTRVGLVAAVLLVTGPLLYLLSVTWLRQWFEQASTIACLAVVMTVVGIAAALTLLRAASRLDDA